MYCYAIESEMRTVDHEKLTVIEVEVTTFKKAMNKAKSKKAKGIYRV